MHENLIFEELQQNSRVECRESHRKLLTLQSKHLMRNDQKYNNDITAKAVNKHWKLQRSRLKALVGLA